MSIADAFEALPPDQQDAFFLKGLKGKDKKKSQLGKQTETLTATALDLITGVGQWSSNDWTPLCDKVCCWRGYFVLVECKETHDPNFEFSRITDKEHLALKATENKHGLGLIIIRWIKTMKQTFCFAISYGELMAIKERQKLKHVKLDSPDLHRWFRPFNFTRDRNLKDQGFPTELEGHVSGMLRVKARPEP